MFENCHDDRVPQTPSDDRIPQTPQTPPQIDEQDDPDMDVGIVNDSEAEMELRDIIRLYDVQDRDQARQR